MTRNEQILHLLTLLKKHRFELDVTAGIEMNHGADGEPFASIPPHLYDKYDASIRHATIEDLKLDVTDKGVTLSLPR